MTIDTQSLKETSLTPSGSPPKFYTSSADAAFVTKRHAIEMSGHGKQPMLFAHGFGCDQHVWTALTPAFSDDYKIVLFDNVGAGQSDLSAFNTAKYATLDGYAGDVIEICDALSLRDVIFVGHSVSAGIGLRAARLRPDLFAKLILIGPSPCYLNDGAYQGGFSVEAIEEMLELLATNFHGWSSAMAPAIMGNPERPELGNDLEASFCRTDPRIAAHFARVTFFSDDRAILGQVQTPCLVMQCSQDIIAPTAVGQYTAAQLPSSKLAILSATGHCPHISHPDEVTTQIRDYLARSHVAN